MLFDPDRALVLRFAHGASHIKDAEDSPCISVDFTSAMRGRSGTSDTDDSSFVDTPATVSSMGSLGSSVTVSPFLPVPSSQLKRLKDDDEISEFSLDMDASLTPIDENSSTYRRIFGVTGTAGTGPGTGPGTGFSNMVSPTGRSVGRQSLGGRPPKSGGGGGGTGTQNRLSEGEGVATLSGRGADKTTLQKVFDMEEVTGSEWTGDEGDTEVQTPVPNRHSYSNNNNNIGGRTGGGAPATAMKGLTPATRIAHTPAGTLQPKSHAKLPPDSGASNRTADSDPWQWDTPGATPTATATPMDHFYTAKSTAPLGAGSSPTQLRVKPDRTIDAEVSDWWAPTIRSDLDAEGGVGDGADDCDTNSSLSPTVAIPTTPAAVSTAVDASTGSKPRVEFSISMNESTLLDVKGPIRADHSILKKSKSIENLGASATPVPVSPTSPTSPRLRSLRRSPSTTGSDAGDSVNEGDDSSSVGAGSARSRLSLRRSLSTRTPGAAGSPRAGSVRRSSSFSSVTSDGIGIQKPPTPERQVGKFLALLAAGNASAARKFLVDSQAEAESGLGTACPRITKGEATALLLKCADDLEALIEPYETISFLVDEFGADVNATDPTGRNPVLMLPSNALLGRFLVKRGCDVLAVDNTGACALSDAFEYGQNWLYETFLQCGEEEKLLASGDAGRIKKYVMCLIVGGLGSSAAEIMTRCGVEILPHTATELMVTCKGNFDNMKEPVETFELLDKLGAQTDC